MEHTTWNGSFLKEVNRLPDAVAVISGSVNYPDIHGRASFWQTDKGTVLSIWATGLPIKGSGNCDHPVYGLHIHAEGDCDAHTHDPFSAVGSHYNPEGCVHPAHAGDLPPLFSNKGEAWMAVLTDRFTVEEVLNRAIVIHHGPDDFRTQPMGASGERIACGVITPVRR